MKLKHKLVLALFMVSTVMLQLAAVNSVQAQSISRDKKIECFKEYDGIGTGRGTDGKFTSKKSEEYSRSRCDVEKGGNCSINGSSQGAIVSCSDPRERDTDSEGSGASASIDSEYDKNDCSADSYSQLNGDNCGVIGIILLITNVLSGLAATVIVAVMITGGIQYSMAGADPSKVQAAKQKIYNALIALVLFIFGFAIIQWLVPGGLF